MTLLGATEGREVRTHRVGLIAFALEFNVTRSKG
jgi:hypothetical protein